MKQFAVLLIAVACGVPPAMADVVDQVTYTINFTGSGILPTSGSFTYDPDTTTFTSFLVTWNGTTFDLTSGANAPVLGTPDPPCLGGATGAAASFDLLTGACPPVPGFFTLWEGQRRASFGDSFFGFATISSSNANDQILVSDIISDNPAFNLGGSGEWSVTPAGTATPEPSSLLLGALSLCALVACSSYLARSFDIWMTTQD